MIERTRFRSTVFLCSEFKLENIYSGVNFAGKMSAVIFICANLFLWIAGKTATIAKIRTRQNLGQLEILQSFIFIHNCIR